MGDYTKLTLQARLAPAKAGAVQQVINDLAAGLANPDGHAFFECARWDVLLSQASVVAAGADPIFRIKGKVKDYEGEVAKLCDWLEPFLAKEEEGTVIGTVEFLEHKDGNKVTQLVVQNGLITEL